MPTFTVSSRTPRIVVSAVVLRDQRGRVLTVRKRGTQRFMLPGGKPEGDETAVQTAVREAGEELGVRLDPARLALLSTSVAPAANEPGHLLESTVFTHPTVTWDGPHHEIEEVRWLDPAAPLPDDLAPMLRDEVLPRLAGHLRFALFLGSAMGRRPEYRAGVVDLVTELGALGHRFVYGGGKVGLMGAAADAAVAVGAPIIGVIPTALADHELAHPGLTNLVVVDGMAPRKALMGELADVVVALPGGPGTLEEFFEAWTWQQLGFHRRPVVLYDIAGFWQPLLALADHAVAEGFMSEEFRRSLIVVRDPQSLLAAVGAWQAPTPKWDD